MAPFNRNAVNSDVTSPPAPKSNFWDTWNAPRLLKHFHFMKSHDAPENRSNKKKIKIIFQWQKRSDFDVKILKKDLFIHLYLAYNTRYTRNHKWTLDKIIENVFLISCRHQDSMITATEQRKISDVKGHVIQKCLKASSLTAMLALSLKVSPYPFAPDPM